MAAIESTNRELIYLAQNISYERSIDLEDVLTAMEYGLEQAATRRYGKAALKVHVDRSSGAINLSYHQRVVEEVADLATEIDLTAARKYKNNAQIDDVIEQELPFPKVDRGMVNIVLRFMINRIKEIELERQYSEFKQQEGHIVTGTIRRIEGYQIVVDVKKVEGILKRNYIIPHETWQVGDKIKCYVVHVRNDYGKVKLILSRTHPNFVAELFIKETLEISEGTVRIKGVVRDPGSKTKIAVFGVNKNIDPVGICIGPKGNRVRQIMSELKGEKIDVVLWSSDPITYIINALTQVEVVKVILDNLSHKAEVVVPDGQLNLAIGRRGQNVFLASQLTGWRIEIIGYNAHKEKRVYALKNTISTFVDKLDVDENIAHLLFLEGFYTLEDIYRASIFDLERIEGFSELAEEISVRAKRAFIEELEAIKATFLESGGDPKLLTYLGDNLELLKILIDQELLTLSDIMIFLENPEEKLLTTLGVVNYIKILEEYCNHE